MNAPLPALSTDQISAFVELARSGSLRVAAEALHISEQGVRSRLIALEERLGVELYRKRRGIHRDSPLTSQGQQFLPRAVAFLERAAELCDVFGDKAQREIHVVASQYLSLYVLIDAVRRFHAAFPEMHVRLSVKTEREIEEALLGDPNITIGVAAPYESSPELEYLHLFSMNWSLIAPPHHALMKRKRISLTDLASQPLILFERGSTGRQHVIDAFHERGLTPLIDMEMTNTEIIVRMVDAGLGVSIVPLLPSGAVTRGRRVGICSLGRQIRPIQSGILIRRGEKLSEPSRRFIEFVRHK